MRCPSLRGPKPTGVLPAIHSPLHFTVALVLLCRTGQWQWLNNHTISEAIIQTSDLGEDHNHGPGQGTTTRSKTCLNNKHQKSTQCTYIYSDTTPEGGRTQGIYRLCFLESLASSGQLDSSSRLSPGAPSALCPLLPVLVW